MCSGRIVLSLLFTGLFTTLVLADNLNDSLKTKECPCGYLFNYLTKKVKDEYLNYHEKISGRDREFRYFTKRIYQQALSLDKNTKKIENIIFKNGKCYNILVHWLAFFNDPHLTLLSSVYRSENYTNQDTETFFSYTDTVRFSLEEFYTYIQEQQRKGKLHPLEGFWSTRYERYGDMIFGIKKIHNQFVGFVINQDYPFWKTGQIRFSIQLNKSKKSENDIFFYYDKFHRFGTYTGRANDDIIEINQVGALYKTDVKNIAEVNIYAQKKAVFRQSEFKVFDSKNILISIPTFGISTKTVIDSLLAKNDSIIKKTEHLIIDIRGNTGGSIRTFDNLLPLIYTNPIYSEAGYSFSTINTINIFTKYYESTLKNRPERATKYLHALQSLKSRPDQWVITTKDTTLHLDTIYPYPQRVSVLIDESTVSAAELFILRARQSKKTTIYGKPSMGGIDLLDYDVDTNFPSQLILFYYPLTKLAPYIQNKDYPKRLFPDIEIPYSNTDWVKFVIDFPTKNDIH